MTMAKGDYGYSTETKANPPGAATPGGFLSVLRRTGPFGLAALCIISVQPLAQVVADYTGHNGNNKGDYIFHGNTSFPLERVAALKIVPNFDRKSNTGAWDFVATSDRK